MHVPSLNNLCNWLGWSCAFVDQFGAFLSNYTYARGADKCRCLSTDPCWPTQAEFDVLASQVSQPLVAPVPPASVCYPSAYSEEECLLAQKSWQDGYWRADRPGAMQHHNFQAYVAPDGSIEACFLNSTIGTECGQGSIPVIGVDVRSVKDIQVAVGFAAKHNLRIVIKNTGHDYLGRSTARGAFMIWTHHMKDITYHKTFVPAGAHHVELHDVMTLGAGVQWQEAYDVAFAHDRNIVGGLSYGATVGTSGGWLQGGGHSALSASYGLGVDNVVEVTIVTANGDFLTVNQYQHADLFWALRGGGGGTWGVVVSVTYQTHPSPPMIAAYLLTSINTTDNAVAGTTPVLKKLFTEFVRMTPALVDGGWTGYADLLPSEDTGVQTLRVAYIAMDVSWETANATMLPLLKFAQELADSSSAEDGGKLTINLASTVPMKSFADWEILIFRDKRGQVGANVELGSWLLPREPLEEKHEQVAEAFLQLGNAGFYIVAGGVVNKVDPDSTGLNPAWRKAVVHAVFGDTWPDGSSFETIQKARDNIKRLEKDLRVLAPDSGAYFNEASLFEDNPRQTFFGSHYDKLRAIKKVYDPSDLFLVSAGIGADEWDSELRCRI